MEDLSKAFEWFPWPVDERATHVRLSLGASDAGARETRGSFTYIDCGAWIGDGQSLPARRDFALVCGRTSVLCEFQGAERLEPLTDFPAAELAPLNRVLAALAGPQRSDVTIRRSLRAPGEVVGDGSVYVFLPDTHLPILTKLPDLHPDLVPDPTKATCPCHGPIVTRILYGTTAAAAQYRAIGASISRNPNDWVFMLAEAHEVAAKDLVRFVDRLTKYAGAQPVHLVQLGSLFDLWDGFSCAFHGNGRMAFIKPEIRAHVSEEELVAYWTGVTHDTRTRDAVLKLLRVPQARRTFVHADYAHGEPAAGGALCRSFERDGVVLAENRPEPFSRCEDAPPLAFLALLEQRAQLRPWTRTLGAGWRWSLVTAAARRFRARAFGTYVMAHTQLPRMVHVEVDPDAEADSSIVDELDLDPTSSTSK